MLAMSAYIVLQITACNSSDETDLAQLSAVQSVSTVKSSDPTNHTAETLIWSESEKSLLKTLAISNLPAPQDPSNQYLNNPIAVKLGKHLFFDPRLSQTGTLSCSTCHQAERAFSDGVRLASGIKQGVRNTPSLLGVSHQQWLFWDGRKDSAWAQALEPFENPNEHNLTRISVIQKVLGDDIYLALYQSIFKDAPEAEEFLSWPKEANPKGDIHSLKQWKSLDIESRKKINRIYSNIGKAIAAFETTLTLPESTFDKFIGQLEKNENTAALTSDEQLGLKLFLGKGACISCHHSALLSSQHFQNIGTGVRGKDMGRSQVAESQVWDEFNCLGDYSDAPPESCKNLKFMSKNRHELAGSFKVPGLRNVSKTAPYLHDGRFKTLEEVVLFYTNPPSQKRTGHHLPEIKLTEQEQRQLVLFLETL